jgi:hypothetical protein
LQFEVKQPEAAGVSVAPFSRKNPKFPRHFKANFIIGNVEVRILSGNHAVRSLVKTPELTQNARDTGLVSAGVILNEYVLKRNLSDEHQLVRDMFDVIRELTRDSVRST